MGVPAHRASKTQGRIRRAIGYYNLKAPALSVCPQCGALKMPHRVCGACGFYNGRQVVTIAVKEDK